MPGTRPRTHPRTRPADVDGEPLRVLVVVGHPLAGSLVHALAAAYVEGASDAQVRVVDLAVDPVPAHPASIDELRAARDGSTAHLGADVVRYVADLRWADHVVLLFPQWWGTYPAVLKAWVDRTFLSGSAFRYGPGRRWERLLRGRTARIVMTMDSPRWWNRLRYRNAAETSLRHAVLAYCGVRVTGVTRFAEVRHQDAATREAWLRTAARLGAQDARRPRAPRVEHDGSPRPAAV
ncbi:NAD(P)H-dependent oxidoreductase [Cellulomonas sp. SLBN-39]|uniref:NAD(P)H-dependent oxidoreductase n=1 Tax=Cellulomonas sp. SLBN-39 TaxID=2768446 RepID=UPI001150AF4B|nr:NAD(P)H-dependent oxidoreductase [Cellulomonas sp. SLBN-39]TQL01496.1 putative NADPH-quinone reductase [Cellulomonas sp. SLBN-39]